MEGKDSTETRCDACGEPGAVVHLTQVVNNETTSSHLCEKCAAEKGIQTGPQPSNLPLADFLAKMGEEEEGGRDPLLDEQTCPFCNLSTRDFREVGRLGCPQCYPTFEGYLRGLLRKIHGGTQHVGKVYLPPDPSVSEKAQQLEGLRRKLARAIEAEDFERAAELRDQIRTLEPMT